MGATVRASYLIERPVLTTGCAFETPYLLTTMPMIFPKKSVVVILVFKNLLLLSACILQASAHQVHLRILLGMT